MTQPKQDVVDVLEKPTKKDLTDLQNALRTRRQPTYPEISDFLALKRKAERRQRHLSLAIG